MATNFDEFMRVTGEGDRKQFTGFDFHKSAQFRVLERDRFGHVAKVMFQLNPQSLKGRKVYFIGFKDGKIRVLKSFRFG
jgi:hypothetical protein